MLANASSAVLRREGIVASNSGGGRIPRKLMDRGVVIPVPTVHRKLAESVLDARRRNAWRLPKP